MKRLSAAKTILFLAALLLVCLTAAAAAEPVRWGGQCASDQNPDYDASDEANIHYGQHYYDPEKIIIKEATCQEAAVQEKRCMYCKTVLEPAHHVGEPLPHTEGTPATCTSGPICSECHQEYDRPDPDAHPQDKIVTDEAVEPTCTRPGKTLGSHCAACGKVLVAQEDVVDEDAHPANMIVTDPAVEPTCVTPGWTEGSHCGACGKVIVEQEEIAPVPGNHVPGKPVRENVRYASCERDGSYDAVVRCVECGEELSRTEKRLAATGHSYAVTGRTIIRLYYECRNCGEKDWTFNQKSRNLQPGLLLDGTEGELRYTSEIRETRGQRVLALTPDDVRAVSGNAETVQAPGLVTLCLRPRDIRQWTADHVDAVILCLPDAGLKVRLYNPEPSWFAPGLTEREVDFYIFTFAAEENGFRVTVEARTGEERMTAEHFSGVTLMTPQEETEITENGVY